MDGWQILRSEHNPDSPPGSFTQTYRQVGQVRMFATLDCQPIPLVRIESERWTR